MAQSGIKIKMEGFDDILAKIQKAGGTIDKAAKTCLEKSADIMQAELKSNMHSKDVSSRLINAMPPPRMYNTIFAL